MIIQEMIISSSLAKDSHPCYAGVGRETVRCVTEPKKSSWFMIDLLGIKVQPTHYSMRHYSSFDTECVRNWRLEGSNNSTTGYDGQWTLLLKHINDTSLNHKGATHTWVLLPNQNNANNNNNSYSQYRLFQFGVNSNQHHYLPLSGFEIYGTIVDGHNAKQIGGPQGGNNQIGNAITVPKGQIRQFKHVSDFDTKGLLYCLGVQGGLYRFILDKNDGIFSWKMTNSNSRYITNSNIRISITIISRNKTNISKCRRST